MKQTTIIIVRKLNLFHIFEYFSFRFVCTRAIHLKNSSNTATGNKIISEKHNTNTTAQKWSPVC